MLVIYTFRLFYVHPVREETREGLVKRGKEERINYIFNLHLNPRRGERKRGKCVSYMSLQFFIRLRRGEMRGKTS